MFVSSITKIKEVCLHHIGNKSLDEGVIISTKPLILDTQSNSSLMTYCFTSFKNEELYHFFNEISLDYHELMGCVRTVFNNPDLLLEKSQDLARLLYSQSDHPNIKSGDLLVVYFSDCEIGGYLTDAIGIYKSENETQYLSFNCSEEASSILTHKGLDIKRVDKAALVFNTDEDSGYSIAIVDNTGGKSDAKFWVEDFLGVKPRQDKYFQTQNFMAACKSFVTKQLPSEFEISKADQVELLNRSVQYFKEKDEFNVQDFSSTVLEQPEVIESFNNYKEKYQTERDIKLNDSFTISDDAVKKQSRSFKSVIKLDKNFHIYVHGDRRMIEQGEDEKGRYYKVYYNEEY